MFGNELTSQFLSASSRLSGIVIIASRSSLHRFSVFSYLAQSFPSPEFILFGKGRSFPKRETTSLSVPNSTLEARDIDGTRFSNASTYLPLPRKQIPFVLLENLKGNCR